MSSLQNSSLLGGQGAVMASPRFRKLLKDVGDNYDSTVDLNEDPAADGGGQDLLNPKLFEFSSMTTDHTDITNIQLGCVLLAPVQALLPITRTTFSARDFLNGTVVAFVPCSTAHLTNASAALSVKVIYYFTPDGVPFEASPEQEGFLPPVGTTVILHPPPSKFIVVTADSWYQRHEGKLHAAMGGGDGGGSGSSSASAGAARTPGRLLGEQRMHISPSSITAYPHTPDRKRNEVETLDGDFVILVSSKDKDQKVIDNQGVLRLAEKGLHLPYLDGTLWWISDETIMAELNKNHLDIASGQSTPATTAQYCLLPKLRNIPAMRNAVWRFQAWAFNFPRPNMAYELHLGHFADHKIFIPHPDMEPTPAHTLTMQRSVENFGKFLWLGLGGVWANRLQGFADSLEGPMWVYIRPYYLCSLIHNLLAAISFGIHKVRRHNLAAHFKNPHTPDGTPITFIGAEQWAIFVQERFLALRPGNEAAVRALCSGHYENTPKFVPPGGKRNLAADDDSDNDTPSEAGSDNFPSTPKKARGHDELCGPHTLGLFACLNRQRKRFTCSRLDCPHVHAASKKVLKRDSLESLIAVSDRFGDTARLVLESYVASLEI
jgi:hypothetical protein